MSGGIVIRSRTALLLFRLASWFNARAVKRTNAKKVGVLSPYGEAFPVKAQWMPYMSSAEQDMTNAAVAEKTD